MSDGDLIASARELITSGAVGRWQPMLVWVVGEFIEIALRQGGPFTKGMAETDLVYLAERDLPRDYRTLARRWKISKSTVGEWIQEWAGGSKISRTRTGQNPDNNGTKNNESESDSGKRRTRTGQNPDNNGTSSPYIRARDRIKSQRTLSLGRPESLEAVTGFFTEKKYLEPEREGTAFWNYYESRGWMIGTPAAPCKNWQNLAGTWNDRTVDRQKLNNGVTTRRNTSAGKQSSYERRAGIKAADVAASRDKLYGPDEPEGT